MGWTGRRVVERDFSHDAKAGYVEALYLDILRRKGCLHE
jgi:hypothetical protein